MVFEGWKTQLLLELQTLFGMQSSRLIFLFSHIFSVENRTCFGYSWHFFYSSKQNKLLSEKLEMNPRRKILFQKWVFGFLLNLMVQHSTHFRGMQLLLSILAYIHVLSILRYLSCISSAVIQKYWWLESHKAVSWGYFGGGFCAGLMEVLPGWDEILCWSYGWYK